MAAKKTTTIFLFENPPGFPREKYLHQARCDSWKPRWVGCWRRWPTPRRWGAGWGKCTPPWILKNTKKHLMDLHVTFNPVIKEQNLQSDALDIESNIIAVSLMERPPLNASFQNRAIEWNYVDTVRYIVMPNMRPPNHPAKWKAFNKFNLITKRINCNVIGSFVLCGWVVRKLEQVNCANIWFLMETFWWKSGGKYSVETCWWKIFGRMEGDQLTGGVELTVADEFSGRGPNF